MFSICPGDFVGTHFRLQPFTYANAEGFSREASLKGGGGGGGGGLGALPSFLWLSASFIQKWRKGCEVASDCAREVARNYTRSWFSLRWDSLVVSTVAGWLAFASWGCGPSRSGARPADSYMHTDRPEREQGYSICGQGREVMTEKDARCHVIQIRA